MFEEEERPRRPIRFTPPVIDSWGVDELTAYIATLRAEISRAEAAIGSRQAQKKAADAFFFRPKEE